MSAKVVRFGIGQDIDTVQHLAAGVFAKTYIFCTHCLILNSFNNLVGAIVIR